MNLKNLAINLRMMLEWEQLRPYTALAKDLSSALSSILSSSQFPITPALETHNPLGSVGTPTHLQMCACHTRMHTHTQINT